MDTNELRNIVYEKAGDGLRKELVEYIVDNLTVKEAIDLASVITDSTSFSLHGMRLKYLAEALAKDLLYEAYEGKTTVGREFLSERGYGHAAKLLSVASYLRAMAEAE